MEKVNITGMTLEQMETLMTSIGQPAYRAAQLFNWIYKRNVTACDQMTNFSKSLRNALSEQVDIGHIDVADQRIAADKSTIKYLFRLRDGRYVESVYMEEGRRRTVCLSSQVGCALGCTFCATGNMGLIRNLSAGEIVDQLLTIHRIVGAEATNVVIMGMGEPFLNYDEVIAACELISHDKGIAIGKRKITISTAGIIPQIKRFTDEGQRFKLAISLNAPDDVTRSGLMPINKKYPIHELMNAAKYYAIKSRNRITFEYVLINGVNDSSDHAQSLKKLIGELRCKINLIPYNAVDGPFQPPSEHRINAFIQPFLDMNVVISVRRSKGSEIQAACGQLFVAAEEKSAQ
ncbi:MAG: 23S rRNA (adenine(2503)-C(2))-methyltransferase RlmN [Candidatus Zhuqueibacterota bacterium]